MTATFRLARFDLVLIKKLKPYYQRRRLSKLARNKRQVRDASRDAADDEQAEAARPPARETARATVPKTVARWLEEHRLFGT